MAPATTTTTTSTATTATQHHHQIPLPASVRGAPPELRRLIRKRQNSESAKRCRLRRKLEAQREASTYRTTAQQMAHLEAMVSALAQQLQDTQAAVASLLSINVKHKELDDVIDSPRSITPSPPPSCLLPTQSAATGLMPAVVDDAIGFSHTLDELELVISS